MKKQGKLQDYYLGLDIGTNSVGYAITDTKYNLIKYKGEPMWGSHVFEGALTKADCRSFRTARRRLNRRKQRVSLTKDIFADEISKVDPLFFRRIEESALFREDTKVKSKPIMFNDTDFKDKDYYEKYPTIHHLIDELMKSTQTHDVRLVYIAVAWLMAHRGHFLSELDKHKIGDFRKFDTVYHQFIDLFDDSIWNCTEIEFQKVLLKKENITSKEKDFYQILNNGKKYKKDVDEFEGCSRNAIIKLLSGGGLKPDKIFLKDEYSELDSIKLSMDQEQFESCLVCLDDDDADVLISMRAISDWAVLEEVFGDNEDDNNDCSISLSKVNLYNQHKKDLMFLKKVIIKQYLPQKYDEVFCDVVEKNYVAYSGNRKKLKEKDLKGVKNCTQEEFCDYIKKIVKDLEVDKKYQEQYDDMMLRLELKTFMPKQVTGDNRVIPYQLYWHELNQILENASTYLPFLLEVSDGMTNKDKLLSIFEFRVPYYVGPLRTNNSANAWMVRKKEGKIYPWNFDEMVDRDKSEQAFYDRMTNTCSYMPGEDVLPKSSLLYEKYMVLNEINNIKINGKAIPVEKKQYIYQCYKAFKKMTVKKLKDALLSDGIMGKDDVLSGIDINLKSSLKSYHDFKKLMDNQLLNEREVEDIIKHITYSEDKGRIRRWIRTTFPQLSEEDVQYVSRLKYKDFGRLSKRLLSEFLCVSKETGEKNSVIYFMWETNDNLQEILLSDKKYTFHEELDEYVSEYYGEHHYTLEKKLEEKYISNMVKRPIYRTLSIVNDIYKVTGKAPKRIFVEMTRGGGEKGKRTNSRRSQIEELYKNFDKQEVRELSKELSGKNDNQLQSEVLFLYFMQLGRCMYSGDQIDIEQLTTGKYNVDHIYPQSKVKDDSISNKVLVLSKLNSDKGDDYPIPKDWRNKMKSFWESLNKHNCISEKKYERLTRITPFTDDEKMGFINRQLVETSQSTKAIGELLKDKFPDSEIVYSKAGLVSDYRHEFNLDKCRNINDLHHAKDAYLNIVCGNVYHCRFTKNFMFDQKYSLKMKTLFEHKVKGDGDYVWVGQEDINRIRKIVLKNNVHYTRFTFNRNGGFFDQMPVKKKAGLVPRKKNLPTDKYGGYNKPGAAFFLMVKYEEVKKKTKQDIMIVPIEKMEATFVMQDEENAKQYAKKAIAQITNNEDSSIHVLNFPLGLRPIKVNTKLLLDGFACCITGKDSGGTKLRISSQTSLILPYVWEQYIKKMIRYTDKKAKNKNLILDEEHDKISKERNIELYTLITDKLNQHVYKKMFTVINQCVQEGREGFEQLALEDQIGVLLSLVDVFATGRTVGCDLSKIGGKGKTGVLTLSSKLSNWNKFDVVKIVDESASGLYTKKSDNILELL